MFLDISHNPSEGEIVLFVLALIAGTLILGALLIWIDQKFNDKDK